MAITNAQKKPSWAHLQQMFRDHLREKPAKTVQGLTDKLDFCGNHLAARTGTGKNRHTWMHTESAGE